ncbi:MAG: glutathione-disulfide reductase [Gammaproteobacteria bacterium]
MADYQYDLFVIGAGSGGVRAARTAGGFGARVAIAEDRYLGGTCVNVGCVPKKLLVHAAHAAEDFAIARSFGWHAENIRFDWQALITNKNREIERLHGVYQRLLDKAGVTVMKGHATLIDEHSISINGATITAENILIATGGWPDVPDVPGREHVITSNEAFFLKKLPERIIICGGGYIAVEFACIFQGLGADTTLVYRGPLFLRGFDLEVREILAEEMRKKGIRLLLSTNVAAIEKLDGYFKVRFTNNEIRDTDLVMYATGRKPNTKNLGLEQAGVRLDDNHAVIVNEHFQSSVPSIHAIGDVIDKVRLTPVAIAEGIALANTLYNRKPSRVNYTDIPTCVFSQPTLGTVGLTEAEAREKYGDVAIYKTRFRPLKLSLSDSEEKTFMKLIVDKKTDRVLGAHMLGAEAGEIIQGLAIALKAGATKAVFDSTIGIHPTVAEEFVTLRTPA